jgi:prevent-host-death family protein
MVLSLMSSKWEDDMPINLSEDIRSVTDLKRKTKEILSQVHRTKRPVVLTLNGKADAVLMDTTTYEKHLKAGNMARFLAPAEQDIAGGQSRSMRTFLKQFKRARKIPR